MLRTQREYGNCNTGTSPLHLIAQTQAKGQVQPITCRQNSVFALFPAQKLARSGCYNKLILCTHSLSQGDTPTIVAEIAHRLRLCGVPLAQRLRRAEQSKSLGRCKSRLNLDIVCSTYHQRLWLNSTSKYAMTEHRGVESLVLWLIVPMVKDLNLPATRNLGEQMSFAILGTKGLSPLDNTVRVAERSVGVEFYIDTPKVALLMAHSGSLALGRHNLQFSTLGGAVVKFNRCFHISNLCIISDICNSKTGRFSTSY